VQKSAYTLAVETKSLDSERTNNKHLIKYTIIELKTMSKKVCLEIMEKQYENNFFINEFA
jgi:hypothetical protein